MCNFGKLRVRYCEISKSSFSMSDRKDRINWVSGQVQLRRNIKVLALAMNLD